MYRLNVRFTPVETTGSLRPFTENKEKQLTLLGSAPWLLGLVYIVGGLKN